MRYYEIAIEGGETYRSRGPNGIPDRGALQVLLDLSVVASDVPASGSYVQIWGLGLKAISQTQNLFNKKIVIKAGFDRGLPLATSASRFSGKLVTGNIFQCFGNWVGTDQTLDLVIQPGANPPVGGGPNPRPPTKNMTLDWKKDTPLGPAIEKCIKQAFPSAKVSVTISPKVVARQDQTGFFATLGQLAQYARRASQDILGGNASGISIINNNDEIRIYDDSLKPGPKQILFQDLIGQPTWIRPQTIQFKTVMRGDIKPGDQITLPKTFFNSSIGAAFQGTSAATGQLGFSGTFQVYTLRHVGNFRQPTAEAWVTIIEAGTTGEGASLFSNFW